MTIYYIAFNRIPTEKAHGLQIVKTCEAFAREGVEVELVIPKRKNSIAKDLFSYYGVKKSFRLTELSGVDLVGCGFIGFLVSLVVFSEQAHFSSRFWKADAIYSRDALVLFQYILLGRPLVFEAHQKPSWLRTFVAQRAKKVIVISHALKRAYVDVGVAAEKIVVAPDAVEYERFQVSESKDSLRERFQLPRGKSLVLYAGHLYARKGAQFLARALQDMPDVVGVFAGGTEMDVKQFKETWRSATNIHILGHRSPEEIPLLLHAADAVALPVTANDDDTKLYASPMKLFEYLASGTAVVASDVPSVREIAGDTEVTFFTPDDAASLRGALTQIFKNTEQAIQKTAQAKQKAKEHTWDARARTVLLSLT